jgi:RNA polymerase sigma factor for flagellar operon FliA
MTTMLARERDAAILSLARYVKRLAARVHSFASKCTVCDTADLQSAGWIAAIRAVDTFDPTRGVPLEGYAQRVIMGAMFNELRCCDPVSERDRRTARFGSRVRDELALELQREPTLAEIEAKVPGFCRAVVRCGLTPLSLNQSPVWCEDAFVVDLSLEGKIAANVDVALAVVAHERSTTLHDALGKLDGRRRSVIESHYFDERPLSEVAQDYQVSSQRASQLHLTALAQLREHLAVA